MTIAGCFCAAFSLFIYSNRVTDAICAFLLLYYYCSAVLRQHILMVNGSSIQPWWILHHYISIAISGVLLVSIQELMIDMAFFNLLFCIQNTLLLVLFIFRHSPMASVSLSNPPIVCFDCIGEGWANGYSCWGRCNNGSGR